MCMYVYVCIYTYTLMYRMYTCMCVCAFMSVMRCDLCLYVAAQP
jgi:hypothetical protein